MSVKHSKIKNTGILFELLVRQVTIDALEGNEEKSKATDILKKYFVKTELGKEYKIYETLFKNKNLSEGKAEIIINTLLDASTKLNRTQLKREKYNLIKEIKENYNINEFFKTKLSNYKEQAALYKLIELHSKEDLKKSYPQEVIDNKFTLLEYIVETPIKKENVTSQVYDNFEKEDKSTRMLTQRFLIEKFNDKYSSLIPSQKVILKEYINSLNNPSKLKEFYNNEVISIRKDLLQLNKKVNDKNTQIKINEVVLLISEIDKNKSINDKDILNLLQYSELVNEVKKVANG